MPPSCPNDATELSQAPNALWRCGRCAGNAATLALLRPNHDRKLLHQIWLSSESGPATKPCPFCRKAMRRARAGDLSVSVCRACYALWMESGQYERIPSERRAPAVVALPQLENALRSTPIPENHGFDDPSKIWDDQDLEKWQYAPALLGLPVKANESPTNRPWVTWTLALIIFLLNLAMEFQDKDYAANWGLIPAQWSRHGGLDFFTSFFLHGGWFHCLSNLYFLMLLGGEIETCLGRGYYLFLIFLSAFVGDFVELSLHMGSEIPRVGASGGLAGLILFYTIVFPKTRLGFFIWAQWFRLSFWLWGGFWFLIQLWLLLSFDDSGIAFGAHIGGAVAGLSFAAIWKYGPEFRDH